MRKFVLAVLLFLCGAVHAQIYAPNPPTTYGQNVLRLKPWLVLHVPEASNQLQNTNDPSAQIRVNSGVLEFYYGGVWTPLTMGSTLAPNWANTDLTLTGDRSHNGFNHDLILNNFKQVGYTANTSWGVDAPQIDFAGALMDIGTSDLKFSSIVTGLSSYDIVLINPSDKKVYRFPSSNLLSRGFGVGGTGLNVLVDSLIISSKAWRQKGVDSLVSIIPSNSKSVIKQLQNGFVSDSLFSISSGVMEYDLKYVNNAYHLFYTVHGGTGTKYRTASTVEGLNTASEAVVLAGQVYPGAYYDADSSKWHLFAEPGTGSIVHFVSTSAGSGYSSFGVVTTGKSDPSIFKGKDGYYYMAYKKTSNVHLGVMRSTSLYSGWTDLGDVFTSAQWWFTDEQSDPNIFYYNYKTYMAFAGWDNLKQRIGIVELNSSMKAADSAYVILNPDSSWHQTAGARKIFDPNFLSVFDSTGWHERLYYSVNNSQTGVRAAWGYVGLKDILQVPQYRPTTVTSVATGFGLLGGTITSTGTVKADTTSGGVQTYARGIKNIDSMVAVNNARYLALTGGTVSGATTFQSSVVINKPTTSSAGTPTVTAQANLGTGATASLLRGNDIEGIIQFTIGTSGTATADANCIFVQFATPLTYLPVIEFGKGGPSTAVLNNGLFYVDSKNATVNGFYINNSSTIAALSGITFYLTYRVGQTN
jgi:hypothetical protein